MRTIVNTWASLKQQADNSDADALERISRAYMPGAARVETQVKALTEQMTALDEAKKLTPTAVKKTAAFTNVITAVEDELDDYEAYLRAEITVAATQSAQQGLAAGKMLLLTAIAQAMKVEVKELPAEVITDVGKNIPKDFLDFLQDYLRPDGPLFKKIKSFSKLYSTWIKEDMLEYVYMGWNPRKIADWLLQQYGMPLTDALRMMRTTQLYSYRQANNATQVANGDVLQGVVWCADIASDRTCMSCIALHGEVFPVGTICNDHHNGRCAMLPWVKGEPNPIEQSGEEWFKSLPASERIARMGKEKHASSTWGEFEFKDMTRIYHDDVFGDMRGEASLKEMLKEDE